MELPNINQNAMSLLNHLSNSSNSFNWKLLFQWSFVNHCISSFDHIHTIKLNDRFTDWLIPYILWPIKWWSNLCLHPTHGTSCDTWFNMSTRLISTADNICSFVSCRKLLTNASSSDSTIDGFPQQELHGSANSTTICIRHKATLMTTRIGSAYEYGLKELISNLKISTLMQKIWNPKELKRTFLYQRKRQKFATNRWKSPIINSTALG